MRPNFALTPNQSFVMAAEMPQRKPAKNDTEITRLDLGGLNGVSLMKPLPKPGQVFSVISAIETKSREGMVPKGFINHTTWVPQSEPLITLDPAVWDQHQFVPWTGSDPVWVELTINNVDGTGHPFHLVSHDSSRRFAVNLTRQL